MSLVVQAKLRKIYLRKNSKSSALESLTPEELDYSLTEGLVDVSPRDVKCKYTITPKGIKFIEHLEYSVADNFMMGLIAAKFKDCWNKSDFSSFSKNQRMDLKKFGLIKNRSAGMYLPTPEGCRVLGITEEEAQKKYDEYNRNLVLAHPRVRRWKPVIVKRRLAISE